MGHAARVFARDDPLTVAPRRRALMYAPRLEDVMSRISSRPAGSILFFLLAISSSPVLADDGHWTLTALENDGPNTWVDIGLVLGDPIPPCSQTTCLPEGRWHLYMSPCPLKMRDAHIVPAPSVDCTNGTAWLTHFGDVAQSGSLELQVLLAPGSYTFTGNYSIIYPSRDHSGFCAGGSACFSARNPASATIDVTPVAVAASTWGRIKALYR